jgi:retinol dehydrogenase 12
MPKVQFTTSRDIPSLEGKEILVTGGNIGLGKQSILEFARHKPQRIWLAARSPEKAEAAIAEVKSEVPDAPVEFLQLDLASFDSIKVAAQRVLESSQRLDILLNNAGIMACPPGLTREGYELQFGTNHVGHALLTKLLLPLLLKTAEAPGSDVRVICLSSLAHRWAPTGGIQFDNLKSRDEKTNDWYRYGQSKLANILFAKQLARKNPQLRVVAVHPGNVNTNLQHGPTDGKPILKFLSTIFMRLFSISVEEGVKGQLWASTAKDVVSGEYYEPVGVAGNGSKDSQDEELAVRLWEWTEKELEGQEVKA